MGAWMIMTAVAWICPECAVFPSTIDEHGRCPTCRRPAVRVEADRRKWYGCTERAGLYLTGVRP